jgi:large subunit ribosomal protein L31
MSCVVTCACGNRVETKSTVEKISVDLCSKCHPFFTGRQKIVDSAGRVEKFKKRYATKKATPAKKSKSKE